MIAVSKKVEMPSDIVFQGRILNIIQNELEYFMPSEKEKRKKHFMPILLDLLVAPYLLNVVIIAAIIIVIIRIVI